MGCGAGVVGAAGRRSAAAQVMADPGASVFDGVAGGDHCLEKSLFIFDWADHLKIKMFRPDQVACYLQNIFSSNSFNFVVSAVNDPPTISAIGGQTINEDTVSPAIPFTVGDLETPANALLVSAKSSNPVLVPNGNIQLAGAGTSRTITLTPAATQNGLATITVTVRDGEGLASSSSFSLTVNAVNDAPTISAIPNQTMNEDTMLSIPVTVGDIDTPLTSLILGAGSSNPHIYLPDNTTYLNSTAIF